MTRPRLAPRPLPVDPSLLAARTVLAFDAALANTGWAIIRNDPVTGLEAVGIGTIRIPTVGKSHEGTYAKAARLEAALPDVFDLWDGTGLVVCERPAVTGYRTESALLAVYEVVRAARSAGAGPVILISRTHVLSLLVGPGKQPKAASTAVAAAWLPGARLNEHTADAVLLAITDLYDTACGGTP